MTSINKHFFYDGFIGMTGIKVLETGQGSAKGEIEIQLNHLNPAGTVHGGVLFTLADSIGGLAASSDGRGCATISSEIHYLNPTMNSKRIVAHSVEIKHGKRMSTVETSITDNNGILIAKMIAVYHYLRKDGKAV
ncbi:PaaI family thioesterase [Parasporobacterium paucivorans]|uniref:Acyl-CoA thioesterase n=1 Tax=Parasporobacterium paucivorans DSM 15970 TaxID=1122934 RepID=A0A1M6A7Q5_9FIRM|nr:PaaI family thioesterase [Parasporobacterium paucivorans]SHI32495.1 acyl-CoA thioesterase [Parasporobacterium paucivorans DSM 15970]